MGIGSCHDSIVVKLHAELNPFVKHKLWIVRSILVDNHKRLHVHVVVINSRFNHSVADCFGYDLLCLLD